MTGPGQEIASAFFSANCSQLCICHRQELAPVRASDEAISSRIVAELAKQGAVRIRRERSGGFCKALRRVLCHVEPFDFAQGRLRVAESRHLAADRARLSFAARSLHYGLRPPVRLGCASGRDDKRRQ